jgi:hypothetical protein
LGLHQLTGDIDGYFDFKREPIPAIVEPGTNVTYEITGTTPHNGSNALRIDDTSTAVGTDGDYKAFNVSARDGALGFWFQISKGWSVAAPQDYLFGVFWGGREDTADVYDSGFALRDTGAGAVSLRWRENASYHTFGNISEDTWYYAEIATRHSDSKVDVVVKNADLSATLFSASDQAATTSEQFFDQVKVYNFADFKGEGIIDDIRVRPYSYPEPSTSLGPTERGGDGGAVRSRTRNRR